MFFRFIFFVFIYSDEQNIYQNIVINSLMSDCFVIWICYIVVDIVFGINLYLFIFYVYFVLFGKKLIKLNLICIDYYGYKI